MTKTQIEFKAEPDSKVVEIKPGDRIRAGDYFLWAKGNYTLVEDGCPLIGETCGAYHMLRIEKPLTLKKS